MVCVRDTPSGTTKDGRPWSYPRPHRLAVGSPDRLGVGLPTIAAPAYGLPPRTGMALRDRFGHQSLVTSSAGMSDNEATLAVLDHQAPALAPSRGGDSANM